MTIKFIVDLPKSLSLQLVNEVQDLISKKFNSICFVHIEGEKIYQDDNKITMKKKVKIPHYKTLEKKK